MQPYPKPANDDSAPDLDEDLLVGAKAIAAHLGWTERRVFHVAEKAEFPIHKIEGFGICTRKSTLLKFFDQLDAPFLNPVEGQVDQG